ncbi:Uncharacterised protein [Prevotella disiens]|uniref:Uncharacterized protein n=2 Tax=Prevotella disiens TaxID=28130 RepID=A0A379EF63_9BACT|nr:hypothetical protein [Prevotella disiens]SUB97544.1 Uncharacterised protein [Prevotella disiens]
MNAENILKGGNAIEFPPFSWILLNLTLLLFPTSMYEFRFTHWIRYSCTLQIELCSRLQYLSHASSGLTKSFFFKCDFSPRACTNFVSLIG